VKRKSNGRKINGTFSPLLWSLIDSDAYRALSPIASRILVLMIRRYNNFDNGGNNGHIMLGSVDAAMHCRCHQSTAWRAMQEIRASGLATITDLGRMVGEDHRASRWRLNFFE
jgi:hypothetical protein